MELTFAVDTFKLDKQYFEQMVDARRRLLRRDAFSDVTEYVATLGEVYQGMNCLLLQVLKGNVDAGVLKFLESFSRTQGKSCF